MSRARTSNPHGVALFSVLFFISLASGCSTHQVGTVDVTLNPDFQGGYRGGEVYRLTKTAYLTRRPPHNYGPDPVEYEILTHADDYPYYDVLVSRYTVAILQPGTLICVNRLKYSYDYYTSSFIETMPLPELVVDPVCTVIVGSKVWTSVLPPYSRSGLFEVKGVLVFPPDPSVMERLGPATESSNAGRATQKSE
jgi:hypothetical protein